MAISATAALWFLPFIVPLCLYVAYTDLSRMKITNRTVMAMVGVFVVVGLIALPFDTYLWRYLHLLVALIIGMALNAVGVMGAGDSKFIAAAAPFIALGDLQMVLALLTVCVFFSLIVHRIIKRTALRRLAPNWISWDVGKKFPLGFALGPTLGLYLIFGALFGS